MSLQGMLLYPLVEKKKVLTFDNSVLLQLYYDFRPTILFFMISGLDMLSALNKISTEEKSHICDWIYTQQVGPRPGQ